jgi:predicted anti-sigma-YlaC factor YlaD
VDAREAVSLRLDDQLSELGERRLVRHLELCPACRQFSDSLLQLTALLRSSRPWREPHAASAPERRQLELV